MSGAERKIHEWFRIYKSSHAATHTDSDTSDYYVGEANNGYEMYLTDTPKRVGILVDNKFDKSILEDQETVVAGFSIYVDLDDDHNMKSLSRAGLESIPEKKAHFEVNVYEPRSQKNYRLFYVP